MRAQSSNASLNGRITDSVKAVTVKANVGAINTTSLFEANATLQENLY